MVRRVACGICRKKFKTAEAAQQHRCAVHDCPEFDPPYDAARGKWVWTHAFEGSKSFGRFKCSTCGNAWLSAHAQPGYGQACQDCELYRRPVAMWVNDDKARSGDRAAGKPHHAGRCEACQAGVCLR